MKTHSEFSSGLEKSALLNDIPIFQNEYVCEERYSDAVTLSALHQHQFTEISYVKSGVGYHRIWNDVIPCKKGSLFVVNTAVPHGYFTKENEEPPAVIRLLFDINTVLSDEVVTIGHEDYLYGIFSQNNFAVHLSLKSRQFEAVENDFKSIQKELTEKPVHWREAVSSQIALLLITLKRLLGETSYPLSDKIAAQQHTATAIAQLANTMYADPDFSLDYVAKQLFIGKSSASRLFKAVTGEYFSDYLRYVRMEKAAALIGQLDDTNDMIAIQCGYRDVPTFYRQFKEEFGESPAAYRKMIKENRNTNKEREKKIMSLLQEISEKLQKGKAKEVQALVEQALTEGVAPADILNNSLLSGMNIVGEKFKNNQVFVPEVLVAARAMTSGLKVLKPALSMAGVEPIGKAIICTVKGDIHDIGKNLVKMMMEGQGIECIDLGVDVDAEKVVQAVQETGATVVCLSALLTTTMSAQKDVIDAFVAAGLRDKVKILVGGAPVTQEFADEIGADIYTMDAASAAQEAKRLMGL